MGTDGKKVSQKPDRLQPGRETAKVPLLVEMVNKIPMEEKLKMLSETDKAYIHGFIERAYLEQQRAKTKKQACE